MTNIVNMTECFERLQWLNRNHRHSWELHLKYEAEHARTGKQRDLYAAQYWFVQHMGYDYEVEMMTGVAC